MELILSDITPRIGTRHNSYIYEITWTDIVDLKIYTTTVDEIMRNFTRSHWYTIVSGDIPYGLYTGLRRTARTDRDNLPVISADSVPQLLDRFTEAQVFTYIERRKEQLGLD